MLTNNRIVIIVLCLLVSLSTLSQIVDPRVEYLSIDDGMSQVSVNDMVVDDGFVWIGTADGLNRYDGNSFKIYKHNSKDSTSISGNYITKITRGHKGELYIGTKGNGLNIFYPEKNIFKRITLAFDFEDETISGVVIKKNSDAIVSTANKGLYLIKDSDGNKHTVKKLLLGQTITSLYYDEMGLLWVGSLNGKVYGYDDKFSKSIVEFNIVGNVQCFFRTGNLLFIGSYDGFFVYDFETQNTESIELEETGNFKTMHVVDFLKEDDTNLWVATGRGLYLYNHSNLKVIKKIEYKETIGNSLSNNTVQSLLKLSPTLLYVGTANELTCLEFKEPVFNNISKNKKGLNILNDNVIFSIYKDDNLWIGTSDGGLNLKTKDSVYYYIDNKNNPSSIAGSVVRAIVHDTVNQRMWFATTRGLSLLKLKGFNPNNPEFVNFYHTPSNPNSINSNFLKDLVLDCNNNLWGATHEHGIFRLEYYENGTYEIIRYVSGDGNENALINNEVNCLEIDKNNTIWVGTQHGMSNIVFDKTYQRIKFENFKSDATTAQTLPHNAINDILIDSQDRVWIGTRNGLGLLEKEVFYAWTAQNQFPNDLIYSIQDDLDDNLWIGTNDGLVKFDTHNQKFSHFSVLDNIQGREFDTHARFRDNEGNIYMGGVDGVTYFHPNDVIALDKPKPLYFSQLQIKDEIIGVDTNNGVLGKVLEKTQKLTFKHDLFPFNLKFSSKDFRFDKNVQFAYKLLPLDNHWNFLNNNTIQFLSLPKGEYMLQVNGFSRGEEWNQEPLTLKIRVKSPWWSSHLAFLTYALVIIALAYWFYQFQLSRKLALEETKRLMQIDGLKSSLYINITHEFRTPVTVILGMVDEIGSKFNIREKKPLRLIKHNAGILLKMVNNMLDLAKLENAGMPLDLVQDNVVGFIKYVFESFESLAEEKRIKYTFYSEIDTLLMDFDSEKLSTILTNLIVNAIKFTPENGQVICHLKKTENNLLHLKVVDSGVGIPEKDLPNVFEKFYQVSQSTTNQFNGTGIGLALTKELVELMEGDIKVNSKEHEGSEFIIKLPIKNEAKLRASVEEPIKTKLNTQEKGKGLNTNLGLDLNDKSAIALIIEDNEDVAYYLKGCLETKYNILCAQDGEEGIKLALKFIPDIIISDVMMPKKDGFEVCKTLKSEIITNHIPIILLTAKATNKDRIEGLSYGADAYLVKPFNKQELFTRIDQLVGVRRKMIEKFAKEDFKEFINRKDKTPQTIFIKKVVDVVSECIDDTEFGPSKLASKLNLSESQLYRKIKATTNRSTAVFIRSIRLNKAKLLIQNSNKTISEIAYEVGFNDPSWFSRAYKDEFGKSPSDIG
ncbi:hybrid sensor histidine kinase/response regulator transcription factor [Aestuariivivens insulae]|uniref:hybrid sensor histidine kinase/response regulator transcription factor n=1 Tax=Aestuariivivens insulae TaxID=1621988 RepID=UPI001F58A01E|nr:hybrid sensor histidine kinase/response regulator transcription factor [Aestuariivivens insulae]